MAQKIESSLEKSFLLLLAHTSVATFNIHARLQIPIKYRNPLHRKAISVFWEEMTHIQYILIDEMNFVGPNLFVSFSFSYSPDIMNIIFHSLVVTTPFSRDTRYTQKIYRNTQRK